MQLVLKRIQLSAGVTIGELYVDGKFECYICEDTVRLEKGESKVPGKTAIPVGRYEVVVTMSNRFKRMLPLLVNVPQFEGIRIHPGNTAEDTEGCLLPGAQRLAAGVGQSKLAFDVLFKKINDQRMRMNSVWILVQNP